MDWNKFFTKEECFEIVKEVEGQDNRICLKCKSTSLIVRAVIRTGNPTPRYECKDCGYSWNILKDTIFEGTHNIRNWFKVMYLRQDGMNRKDTAQELGMKVDTVSKMYQLIDRSKWDRFVFED